MRLSIHWLVGLALIAGQAAAQHCIESAHATCEPWMDGIRTQAFNQTCDRLTFDPPDVAIASEVSITTDHPDTDRIMKSTLQS